MNLDRYRVASGSTVRLSKFATDAKIGGKEKVAAQNRERQIRIGELQELLYADGKHRLLVVLQGMDTSGKDGTIRKVLSGVSPQGMRVVSFKKPTDAELARDYLWRIHAHVPAAGELVVFNRSHYEDVLVVRVHSLVPEEVWRRRYDQINAFELMLAESGTTILKFFLHISKEEQRERLQARLDDPTKRWKFQHGDLAERKRWDDYVKAYEEALSRTSTEVAPWHIVPADRKWVRDAIVAEVIEEKLRSLDMRYPTPDLAGVTVS